MGPKPGHGNALKWYPRSWRDRYGEDLEAFLEDRYGVGPVPRSARLSMIRSGTVERLRAGGIIGSAVDPDVSVRGGSLLVLSAWGMFVVAGSAFAKYTEHWPLATPHVDYLLPATAMGAVQASAALGVVILAVAGILTLPALVGFVRSEGWRSMWELLKPSAISVAVAGLASIVVIAWNQHVGSSTGADVAPLGLRVAGFAGGLLVVGALAVCCGTAVAIVFRLRLSHRVTSMLGTLTVAMTGVLVVIFGGALTWWISTAIHAPWFFGSLVPRSPTSPAPLAMIVLAMMMLSGLVLAAIGTFRIAGAMNRSGVADPVTQHD